ncbi:hypothetical protein CDAR_526671 [Caerostris darwini]|uniref:Uncharacterized protein n=1 Tax=Caerostris darwini TaxID=1538125 RepID=A0AAV4Q145_9ARAC|nr:hypothetical protein CDAR_526671 [Caerostris darwini]
MFELRLRVLKIYSMSSLPQGWHGIPVPTRNSISSSTISAATPVSTTIRKKWNSPLSSEVPRSKLPAYKPSALRLHKSPVNGILPTRTNSKIPGTSSKNDVATCPTKPSPIKQLQNEIVKLKKELTTMKTENSILKVKVRRVDDENVQKSRQIEKLKVELKAAQKVDSTSSKKNKDSDLLLLRQKCLRLEGALKEKDLALKRLNNEASLKLEGRASRNSLTNFEAGDADDSNENCRTLKKNASAKTSFSRSSHSTKTEVSKLREMIHKLEKENQELQQLAKDKSEEVRRLKMHLRSRTYIKSPQTSESKTAFKVNPPTILESVPSVSKPNKPVPSLLKSKKPSPVQNVAKPPLIKKTSKVGISQVKKPNNENTPKALPRINSLPKKNKAEVNKGKANIHIEVLKTHSSEKQAAEMQAVKRPVIRPGKTFLASKLVVPNSLPMEPFENNIEDEVQRMRENIAAKKIQRSWRYHQKQHSKKDEQLNIQKALTFIVTSLKHHKLRKEKMSMLQKRKNISPRAKLGDESVIVEAIQTAARNLWEKQISVTPTN